jgi:signal transduction histidine kinase
MVSAKRHVNAKLRAHALGADSSAVPPDRRDSSAVSPDRRDSSVVPPDRRDSSAVSPDRRDSSVVSPDRRDSALAITPRMIVEASPIAAAVYENNELSICSNKMFLDEFPLCEALSLRQLLDQFEFSPDSASNVVAARSLSTPSCMEAFSPKSKRWFRIHLRDLSSGGNTLTLCLVQNISDRLDAILLQKDQHEKLLMTSRMMSVGEMTTMLAHELNQPLASVVNYLSTASRLLERVDAPPPRLRDSLSLARQQAERASQVIQRLREFVRTREPKRSAMSLGETALSVLRLLDQEIKKIRVQTKVEIPESMPAVFADRVMVEQVVFNLVKNAMEAMRDVAQSQRELCIRARITLDGEAELRVIDRGIGFESTDQQQLFSPFFTTKSDGMGIGLSICRSIIEYHQGQMFFEANPEGGATFGFRLPVAEIN